MIDPSQSAASVVTASAEDIPQTPTSSTGSVSSTTTQLNGSSSVTGSLGLNVLHRLASLILNTSVDASDAIGFADEDLCGAVGQLLPPYYGADEGSVQLEAAIPSQPLGTGRGGVGPGNNDSEEEESGSGAVLSVTIRGADADDGGRPAPKWDAALRTDFAGLAFDASGGLGGDGTLRSPVLQLPNGTAMAALDATTDGLFGAYLKIGPMCTRAQFVYDRHRGGAAMSPTAATAGAGMPLGGMLLGGRLATSSFQGSLRLGLPDGVASGYRLPMEAVTNAARCVALGMRWEAGTDVVRGTVAFQSNRATQDLWSYDPRQQGQQQAQHGGGLLATALSSVGASARRWLEGAEWTLYSARLLHNGSQDADEADQRGSVGARIAFPSLGLSTAVVAELVGADPSSQAVEFAWGVKKDLPLLPFPSTLVGGRSAGGEWGVGVTSQVLDVALGLGAHFPAASRKPIFGLQISF